MNKMKKSILTILTTLVMFGTFLASCKSPSEKVVIAEEKLKDAKEDLEEAKFDFQKDIETYRQETALKVEENNKTIVELKARLRYQKAEAKDKMETKINELEQKNKDLKQRLADYKGEGKDNWEVFKKEFNRDMEELAKAFKDLTVKNVE